MNEEELEEKKDEVEEKPEAEESVEGVEADTRTAETGSDEAPVEDKPKEEEVGSSPVEENPVMEEESEPAPAGEEPTPEPEKMLTQSQVNELVGRARAEGRESAMKELYGRYGVNSDQEMNDIFGRGQGYELLNEDYQGLTGRYNDLAAENALLKSGILPARYDDVKAILGMKGMQVTAENIATELATHPEWKKGVAMDSKEITPDMAEQMAEQSKPGKMEPAQTSFIKKLGSSVPEPQIDVEENKAMAMFGYGK